MIALLLVAASTTTPSLIDPTFTLEYRVRHETIRPLSLNDLSAPSVGFFDQRLRLGAEVAIGRYVKVVALADVLDGVLFGDNGSFVGAPRKNRGSVVATRSPNLSRIAVDRLPGAGGQLDRDSYGYVLVDAPPLTLRRAYGEVLLPVGLIRAGRQPIGFGRSVLTHEGTRINRWGISRGADTLDALTFGTKASAIAQAIAGEEIDTRTDRGLFAAVMFGQVVEQDVQRSDDLFQIVGTSFYLAQDELDFDNIRAGVIAAGRVGHRFDTRLLTLSGYIELVRGPLYLNVHHAQMFGATREISEGLSRLGATSGPPAEQAIRAFGGFAELGLKVEPFRFIFEAFYASGDEDPRSSTPITQLTFAEDTNVGLHLFENVLAYESARSARLGVVNLSAIAPPTFAVAEIDTRGGFTNAVALFPQVVADPFEWLSLRGGVLFAFAAVPVVDPIGSILASDGLEISDDAVNFHGGKPASYWGTELDFGLTLRPVDAFDWDFEAAYLLPGAALQDENGDAASSWFVTTRLTFFTP